MQSESNGRGGARDSGPADWNSPKRTGFSLITTRKRNRFLQIGFPPRSARAFPVPTPSV
jgi:hypothetical protein